ncbi:sigma-70 family RNA polymerase sigma factor [Ruminococcus sp. FC2018]|uniref:RNA polymerase sigma factor n=1 Tax=Ruminococcus sp. FC2018 TaxID=1410617 RepID=UPI000491DD1B|nr:sigma-70 family RNA polymerase sigma factor [Ruminococcus sp. FC2018]
MSNDELIALLEVKDKNALVELENKYGGYCKSIAMNILRSREDTQECLNDVYLSVWNSIPPGKPEDLKMYIAEITRNTAINLWRRKHAQKRGSGHIELLLEELSDEAASESALEKLDDTLALREAFNSFLGSLKPEQRRIFLLRYWYMHTVREIAQKLEISQSKVKVSLHRTRVKLKKLLEREGLL